MKIVTKCCLGLLLLLLTVLPAVATNYYVDPSSQGSNQGTFNNPWRSLDVVPETINYYQPGDTVFFKRGQHYVGTLSINSSGSNGHPIVFMPYGTGDAPVFHYNLANPPDPAVPNRMIIRLNRANYIVIDGFELIDTSVPEYDRTVAANVGHGVYIYRGNGNNGSYNTIKNLTISRLGAGITIDEGSDNIISDCVIRNMRMAVNTPFNPYDDWGAVGIIVGGSNNTISHNRFEGCWANSYDFIYDGGAIEMYGPVDNNKILYNTATDNLGFMEFGSSSGGQAHNNLLAYNLLVNNGHVMWINAGNGFSLDVRNLQFYNNNVIETLPPKIADITALIGIASTPTVSNVVNMRNNVFWTTTTVNITDIRLKPFDGPQLIRSNNIYRTGGGQLGFTADFTDRILNQQDVLFANTSSSDPLNWDFNLQVGSLAVNAGALTGIDKDYYGQPVPIGGITDIGIAENISVILPIEFVSTKGWNAVSGNIIEWVTNTDVADHFEVEKSTNGTSFQKIATVPFKENRGASTVTYQFTDVAVTNEIQYYRIKVVENGNANLYSKIITIKSGDLQTEFMVSPNPAQDNIYLRLSGNDFTNKELVLVNMLGAEIKRTTLNQSTSQLPFNISMLPRGVYVVRITDRKTGKQYQTIFTKG